MCLPGALVGSLDLLSMGLELAIQGIIAANDGFFMANGPPVTIGIDVKVILTPPCIFCIENH